MSGIFIGLGSNLQDPKKQIIAAIAQLSNHHDITVTKISSLYHSRPMGPQDQPDYMNAVVQIATPLSPLLLLDQLQVIEHNAGRERKGDRWGARILDLDILLFNNEIINSARLTIPHYGLKMREFVLLPLVEIAPNLLLPDGDNLASLAKKVATNGLKIHSKLS